MAEETTTAHFSGNVAQVACYPVVVKWQDRDRNNHKGGMVYLSSDRKHDHEQESALSVAKSLHKLQNIFAGAIFRAGSVQVHER